MPSVTPWCPFKTHSRPFSLTYLWIYSILSFFLLTRQWCCSKEVATLLLLGCYLSGSKPFMEKSYVGFHCLSALSHLFPLTIYFVIMFSSFFADYVTESFLYWQFRFVIDFSHESEFCNKQWLFGRWYYCSSPVVYKKKLSYKSEVNCIFQNDTKLYTVFIWEGFKIMYVFFSELVLNRFYECISPINFGI